MKLEILAEDLPKGAIRIINITAPEFRILDKRFKSISELEAAIKDLPEDTLKSEYYDRTTLYLMGKRYNYSLNRANREKTIFSSIGTIFNSPD